MAVKVTKENPEGTKKTAFFLRDLFKKQGVRARRIQSPGAALRQPCMNRTTRNRDTDREEPSFLLFYSVRMTPDLLALTIRVWSPRYGRPLSPEEAVEILRAVGHLLAALRPGRSASQ